MKIESVTEEELAALKKNECPDCGGSEWLNGPGGGCSQNVECGGCGSRFNLTPGFGAERIRGPSPKLSEPVTEGPFR